MNIHGQMVEVTRRIAREGIGKTRNNAQQGYKFRGVDEVMNAFAPILADAGLFLRPRFTERDCAERVTAKGSPLFYVTVKGEFDFTNDAGEWVTVGPFYGEAMDTADKATNKAMAVAFKYAMFQTFCVPLEGVTGGDADQVTHDVAVHITEQQAATLRDMIEMSNSDTAKFCAAYGVTSVDELPASKLDSALAALNKKLAKAA
jgi:hypothetical protein